MQTNRDTTQAKGKRNGFLISMFVHTGFIILLLLPLLKIPIPPPGQEGVTVALGIPDAGQGPEETPGAAENTSEPTPEVKPEPQPTPRPAEKTPTPVPDKKVVTTEDPETIAINQEKERKRQQEEDNRNKQAEEDRKKAEAEKLKSDLKNAFNKPGGGSKPGTPGDKDGDPNAGALKGVSDGLGKIGGGLQGRGVRAQPRISENSQQEGTVVIEVCVDKSGAVISAKSTIRGGATITNPETIEIARKNALQWTFDPGEVDRQCGTITYRFKLK